MAVLILKLSFVNYYPSLATITATRASVVLLYMRIFPLEMSRVFRAGCIVLLVIFAAYIITFFVALALTCQPLKMIRKPTIKGHCIDGTAVVNASIVVNVVWTALWYSRLFDGMDTRHVSATTLRRAQCLCTRRLRHCLLDRQASAPV